ncbi:MAG: helix-turn-helix domain-containing protein [Tannerella sp.]|nr:helix-turn-helix domain-containing protein [Tannerella sp.]
MNIIKIRNEKRLMQIDIAAMLGIDMSTYSKIESGKIALTVDRLAKIASFFDMEVVDVIYWPARYVKYDSLNASEKNSHQPKVTIQIELSEEKKEKVLEMLFDGKELGILKY